MKSTLYAVAAALAAASAGHAQTTLAEWTFEVSVPTTAGPHVAEGGVVTGSEALGFHASASAVYSNPVGNGSGESFSSNFWAVGDYYQVRTSTTGYQSITVSWDQTRSSTGPATFDAAWSTDGQNFTPFSTDYTVLTTTWTSTPPVNPASSFVGLTVPAGGDNQADLYIRFIAKAAPTGTAGTNRIDNIVIAGEAMTAVCYPDCNEDGALNLSDFVCFQTKFALGDMYTDCNGDGVLNLSDFGCFQTKFALGCP